MEDSSYDDDPNINPQLNENILRKSEYIFHLKSTKKIVGHTIDHAIKNTKAFQTFLFLQKFNHFALTFNFLTPKEKIFTVHTKSS